MIVLVPRSCRLRLPDSKQPQDLKQSLNQNNHQCTPPSPGGPLEIRSDKFSLRLSAWLTEAPVIGLSSAMIGKFPRKPKRPADLAELSEKNEAALLSHRPLILFDIALAYRISPVFRRASSR